MKILFQCPICGQQYEVPPERAGAQVLCQGCKRRVVVPHPNPSPLGPTRPRTPGRLTKSPNPTVWLGAIGGGVALLVVIGLVFAFVGGKGDDASAPSRETARSDSGDSRDVSSDQGTPGHENEVASSLASLLDATDSGQLASDELETSDDPVGSDAWSDTGDTASGDAFQPAEFEPSGPSIPVGDREEVTFGVPGCPVVVVGTAVWNLGEQTVQSTLQRGYEERGLTALSADGRFFAATELAVHNRANPVFVWNATTGEPYFRIPGDANGTTDFLAMAGDRIFVGGRSSNQLKVWSLSRGQEEQPLALPGRRVERSNIAIAHDGVRVVTVDNSKLVLLSADTGATLVRMRAPKQIKKDRGPKLPEGMVRVDRGGWIVDDDGGPADESECRSIYSALKAIQFSPDSHEVVAISTHPKPRVICWNDQGRRILDEVLNTDRDHFGRQSIGWFPNGKAWLVGSDVFDRESGKIVLSVSGAQGHDSRLQVQDDGHLLGVFADRSKALQVREIPWDGIRQALAQLEEEDAPALLSPAKPVSIVFELGNLRGNQNQTVQNLGEALKERLERDGFEVEKGQSTFFRVRFSEKAGDTVAVHERQTPFDRRGRDTGQRVREAEGEVVVELVVPGKDEPVWRDSLSAGSDSSYRGEVNDMTVRDSMVENLGNRMDELNFPYFIPESEDMLALPVILE